MSRDCGHRGNCRRDADCLVVMWGNQLAYWLTMMSHSPPADEADEAAYRRIIRGVLDAYGCEYRPPTEGGSPEQVELRRLTLLLEEQAAANRREGGG